MCYLSRPLWQATDARNLRKSTVVYKYIQEEKGQSTTAVDNQLKAAVNTMYRDILIDA